MRSSINTLFRGLYRVCECGCGILIPIVNKMSKLARFKHGHHARGQNHPGWKGGRIKVDKYWFLWIPGYSSSDNDNYVREHVYFYEQYNKLCMLPWGVVHHKEPVTKDYCNNMPWNLQGMTESQHATLHMKGNQYSKKDMTNRICSLCNKKTLFDNTNREHWYGNKLSGWLCNRCYEKIKYKNQKLKGLLITPHLPVLSNSFLQIPSVSILLQE